MKSRSVRAIILAAAVLLQINLLFACTVREADAFNPLKIAAENGLTIITLHPAMHRQVLGN